MVDITNREVTTVSGVASSHHVLSIEHLLSKLRNSDGAVLLAAAGGKRSEGGHEEVETGEGNCGTVSATAETKSALKAYPC